MVEQASDTLVLLIAPAIAAELQHPDGSDGGSVSQLHLPSQRHEQPAAAGRHQGTGMDQLFLLKGPPTGSTDDPRTSLLLSLTRYRPHSPVILVLVTTTSTIVLN